MFQDRLRETSCRMVCALTEILPQYFPNTSQGQQIWLFSLAARDEVLKGRDVLKEKNYSRRMEKFITREV
jgi:hypothetical protein